MADEYREMFWEKVKLGKCFTESEIFFGNRREILNRGNASLPQRDGRPWGSYRAHMIYAPSGGPTRIGVYFGGAARARPPDNWETLMCSSDLATFSSNILGFPQYIWQVCAYYSMDRWMLHVCKTVCAFFVKSSLLSALGFKRLMGWPLLSASVTTTTQYSSIRPSLPHFLVPLFFPEFPHW